jgi:predicted membrane-bound mannosyltransferase
VTLSPALGVVALVAASVLVCREARRQPTTGRRFAFYGAGLVTLVLVAGLFGDVFWTVVAVVVMLLSAGTQELQRVARDARARRLRDRRTS